MNRRSRRKKIVKDYNKYDMKGTIDNSIKNLFVTLIFRNKKNPNRKYNHLSSANASVDRVAFIRIILILF